MLRQVIFDIFYLNYTILMSLLSVYRGTENLLSGVLYPNRFVWHSLSLGEYQTFFCVVSIFQFTKKTL